MSVHTVFVYGTLKRGCSNHHFLEGARFLGRALTVERYALYLGRYPFCHAGEAISRIRGEMYEADGPCLDRLDMLEDHPRVYRREQVEVEISGGRVVRAWLYFYPRPEGRLLPQGLYEE